MTERVRVAVLSFWHVHAKDYARAAAEHPSVDLVAAWDEDAGRGRDWADRHMYHLLLNSCMGIDAMVHATIDAAGAISK